MGCGIPIAAPPGGGSPEPMNATNAAHPRLYVSRHLLRRLQRLRRWTPAITQHTPIAFNARTVVRVSVPHGNVQPAERVSTYVQPGVSRTRCAHGLRRTPVCGRVHGLRRTPARGARRSVAASPSSLDPRATRFLGRIRVSNPRQPASTKNISKSRRFRCARPTTRGERRPMPRGAGLSRGRYGADGEATDALRASATCSGAAYTTSSVPPARVAERSR